MPLVPEEPNFTAWLRVVLYLAILIRYTMYFVKFERAPGNGGKFVQRYLLIPYIAMLVAGLFAALGKATDVAENLQALLIGAGLIGVVCLAMIEHHGKKRKGRP